MNRLQTIAFVLASVPGISAAAGTAHYELPPSCTTVTAVADDKTPIKVLRQRVEAENESDPTKAFGILCTTIPRVAAKYGEQSEEFAWWFASLATPLIAYMDKFDEALPVLKFAQPLLERQYGRYGEALGDVHVAYGWIYFRQGRLTESNAEWTEALKVRERFPGKKKIELQKALVGLAQVQLSQREFAAAEHNLERAHAILVENHDTVSEAGAAIESARTAATFRQERYQEARQHAEETLRIEHQLQGGAAQFVTNYAMLGRILERLDEYAQAEQALRRAVELSEGEQGPLQRHHFAALYQLAALLDERNRAVEAREEAIRALKLGESTLGASAPRLVPVLQVLGNAEHQLGQLPDALRQFERAGAIIAADRANLETSWLVDYYRDLGALQMSLGSRTEAERTLAAGLDAAGDDPTLAVERARLLVEHSRAAGDVGQHGRDELLQAAALLRTALPDSHPAILRVLNELCELELSVPAGAPDCAETAARLARAPDTSPDLRAAVYGNQSRLATARSNGAEARSFAVRAVAAAESAGTPEPLWQAYFLLAAVLRIHDETPLAVFFGKEAVAQIELERSRLVGDDRRFDSGFLRDKVAVYRSVADWLMETGRIDEGLAVLKLMKSEELSDFGVRDAALAPDRAGLLTDQESALQERYSRAVQADAKPDAELSRLTKLDEADKISPLERDRLRMLLAGKSETEDARSARIEQLLQGTVSSTVDDGVQQKTIAAPALARAARGFGPDTAFAVYLLTEHHLRILVTARGDQESFSVPVDGAQLRRDIGHFLDGIAQRRDAGELSKALYEVIARRVDEFAEKHRVHRLVLWLDGPLRYVPIAALRDESRYLLDKYVIQIYTPAAESNDAKMALRPADWQIRGLGVTKAMEGFPALPSVADELCYVVHGPIEGLNSSSAACSAPSTGNGALNGAGYADAAFTEQRFKALLEGTRDFSVLHIGTHFRLRPGNALRSFLLLGDGSKLTLDAISDYDFRAIDLVTLSACETGLGGARTDDGREIEGLSALVQRRGASRVIASLWQVEDASTAQLMRTLYKSFSTTRGDAALGLQQAQRTVRSLSARNGTSYADPYYWAGFLVSGSRP
jgi:CHAT domain-containing protein/tetratricopeptide (TPR) repeat protein